MFDHLCLICIHYDANLELMQRHLKRLYSPEVEKVYVRISKDLDLLDRAKMLIAIRRVFVDVEIDIVTVSDYQIHLVAAMVEFTEKRRNR